MRALFFLPLVVLLAAAALAAPVPLPRTAPMPWHFGWDEPLDPAGGCRFRRDGGELAISLPGGEDRYGLYFLELKPEFTAPRLMRRAEGDFTLQARVALDLPPGEGFSRAGLVLLEGERGVTVDLGASRIEGQGRHTVSGAFFQPNSGSLTELPGNRGPAAHLRLERRGQRLLAATSADGKVWTEVLDGEFFFELPQAVLVGAYASCQADGTFTATSDQLKFTQPKPKKD
jgi:regulation of enolase protein 1 (concanavalin A-like superfamily)